MLENEYRDRNVLLKKMGYANYTEYLQSELWKGIRERCFEKGRSKCSLCLVVATQVHHLTYSEKIMRGETLDGLVLVCGKCHYKVEFDSNGVKRDVHQARDRYYALRKMKKQVTLEYCTTCRKPRKYGGCPIWCRKFKNPEYVPTKKALKKEGLCECGAKKSNKKYPRCSKCQKIWVQSIISNKKRKGKDVY